MTSRNKQVQLYDKVMISGCPKTAPNLLLRGYFLAKEW